MEPRILVSCDSVEVMLANRLDARARAVKLSEPVCLLPFLGALVSAILRDILGAKNIFGKGPIGRKRHSGSSSFECGLLLWRDTHEGKRAFR